MTHQLRVALEVGPKGKKIVALAPDWPGLERGAATEDAALAKLQSYLPRYVPVAKLAGREQEFDATMMVEVVERYEGVGSTDFWGIAFAFSSFDRQAMTYEQLERELSLMQACWQYFDDVRSRVSSELKKGPRGGGRDRDRIVRHTVVAEMEWARKLGLPMPESQTLTDEMVTAHRVAYISAIRAFHAEGKTARTWPLRFLIRHTAYHTLDHTWEMQDKDLTSAS